MARLGKRPVEIPSSVKVAVVDNMIQVESSKGKMEHIIFPFLEIVVEEGKIYVKNSVQEKEKKLYRKTEAFQGLLRKLIINMFVGLTEGFERILELNGVGYKAEVNGNKLILSVGFSNPVEVDIPEGISAEVTRNTIIILKSMDLQKLGNYAATIRKISPPEPYKGKGIRYRGEYVRHKAGKTGVGAAQ
jgi:large subunit ribosomal protein L6